VRILTPEELRARCSAGMLLTYADVCRRILTYADVCIRMQEQGAERRHGAVAVKVEEGQDGRDGGRQAINQAPNWKSNSAR
jgi:hypothetical protein